MFPSRSGQTFIGVSRTALNSNFVINRLGVTPCDTNGESGQAPEKADSTYTVSRLGLAFVGQDQPEVEPAETSSPEPAALTVVDTVDSRLGISPEEAELVKSDKPFWPNFRNAAVMLSEAVKKRILSKLKPQRKTTEHKEVSNQFVFKTADCPAPTAAWERPSTLYRRGTYKLPSELMARLKTCAAANHQYQYRVVIESLETFLTSKGFAREAEADNNSQE